jgi:hypothetical protein
VSSFARSLQTAVVDVPLLISSMGQECDIAPDTDFHAAPMSHWLLALNATFNQPPWQQGSDVAAAYANDSAVDPALAYASINADYSLTCGNVAISVAAKLAAFKSAIYVVVNQWHPSHTPAQQRPRWAFHTFDYRAAFEQWDVLQIEPSEQDQNFSRVMREMFAAFIYANATAQSASYLQTVDSNSDFPKKTVTNVVAAESGGCVAVANYKAGQCDLWAAMGLDERFWWID